MTTFESATARLERAARRRTSASVLGILLELMIRGGSILLSLAGLAFGVAAAYVWWGVGGALAGACVSCLLLAVAVERGAADGQMDSDIPPVSDQQLPPYVPGRSR
jgi:hypothetical protein